MSAPVYLSVASAALICAAVPLRVRVAESLAPALMLAPPAVTFSVPWPTLRRVLARLALMSLTLRPVMLSAVSSATVCAPGTTLTGAVLGTLTVLARLRVAVSVPLLVVPPLSCKLVRVMTRLPMLCTLDVLL